MIDFALFTAGWHVVVRGVRLSVVFIGGDQTGAWWLDV
jgi:hypothetical protein